MLSHFEEKKLKITKNDATSLSANALQGVCCRRQLYLFIVLPYGLAIHTHTLKHTHTRTHMKT